MLSDPYTIELYLGRSPEDIAALEALRTWRQEQETWTWQQGDPPHWEWEIVSGDLNDPNSNVVIRQCASWWWE